MHSQCPANRGLGSETQHRAENAKVSNRMQAECTGTGNGANQDPEPRGADTKGGGGSCDLEGSEGIPDPRSGSSDAPLARLSAGPARGTQALAERDACTPTGDQSQRSRIFRVRQ